MHLVSNQKMTGFASLSVQIKVKNVQWVQHVCQYQKMYKWRVLNKVMTQKISATFNNHPMRNHHLRNKAKNVKPMKATSPQNTLVLILVHVIHHRNQVEFVLINRKVSKKTHNKVE